MRARSRNAQTPADEGWNCEKPCQKKGSKAICWEATSRKHAPKEQPQGTNTTKKLKTQILKKKHNKQGPKPSAES